MSTMGGESRGPNREIKGRVNHPSDKHRQDETSTRGSDYEIRRYAELILFKVGKLETELASLSLKCTRGNPGRGQERGSSDDLSRFKTEMEEGCGRLQGELLSLRKLAEVLADHVKKPGCEPKSSTCSPSSSSSSPLESPKTNEQTPAIAKVTPGPSTQTLPANDSTAQIVDRDCDPMTPEQVPQSISAISSTSSSGHIAPEAGNNVQPQTSTSTLLPTEIEGHARERTLPKQMKRGCKLECVFCQKKSTCMSQLERHLLSHIGERPYFCKLCPKRFFTRNVLDEHMSCHTTVKKFKCQVCQQCFAVKEYLRKHVRDVHEKRLKFRCDECPKVCSRNSSLKLHKLVHTGETD